LQKYFIDFINKYLLIIRYKRSLAASIIILFVAFGVAIFLLVNLVCNNEQDPLERAVSEVLGDPRLTLRSKLGIWVEVLDQPDFVIKSEYVYKTTELFWLNHGIGVQTYGWVYDDSGVKVYEGKKIREIFLPIKHKVPSYFSKRIGNTSSLRNSDLQIEFKKSITNLKARDNPQRTYNPIEFIYLYYKQDPSDHGYYKMPIFFAKTAIHTYESQLSNVKRSKYDLDWIVLRDISLFDIENFYYGHKRAINMFTKE